ncbi:hypothetical protein DFH07DRAFT_780557 [Mycena maculata]|uniref:Uncharacterized protein n=1 Tax=Mycena maculata TaxID=230809 RepID=A0AAD7I2T2_9AGAR|nr:hypothetical protein DFH07DRAFT_780557 [Mycena maculata]
MEQRARVHPPNDEDGGWNAEAINQRSSPTYVSLLTSNVDAPPRSAPNSAILNVPGVVHCGTIHASDTSGHVFWGQSETPAKNLKGPPRRSPRLLKLSKPKPFDAGPVCDHGLPNWELVRKVPSPNAAGGGFVWEGDISQLPLLKGPLGSSQGAPRFPKLSEVEAVDAEAVCDEDHPQLGTRGEDPLRRPPRGFLAKLLRVGVVWDEDISPIPIGIELKVNRGPVGCFQKVKKGFRSFSMPCMLARQEETEFPGRTGSILML